MVLTLEEKLKVTKQSLPKNEDKEMTIRMSKAQSHLVVCILPFNLVRVHHFFVITWAVFVQLWGTKIGDCWDRDNRMLPGKKERDQQ